MPTSVPAGPSVQDYDPCNRLAAWSGDRAEHSAGLCPDLEGPGRRALSPGAAHITLVCDNLNPHKPRGLYARSEPATVRRRARCLEWVYTPKQVRWLNSAEIEIHVLTRQARARCIPDAVALHAQVTAGAAQRHQLDTPPWALRYR